jgi:hypothetical protein
MNDCMKERNLLASRATLVVSLLAGALGIALMWAGGVDFPVAVPPGIVILLVGAAVAAGWRSRWSAAVGAFLGLFVLVGFVVSCFAGDGIDNLTGESGALVALGQVIQLVGVAVATVSGTLVARRGA